MESSSRSFYYRHRVFVRVSGIVLLFIAVLGGVYCLTLFGPQRVDSRQRPAASAEVTKQTAALEAQSNQLHEQFEKAVALRPATE